MTSIAQGKRSDTLGKPPHHITPRPVRAKVNITRSVSALLPLHGASHTAHYTQGAASLAAGLWTSAPSGRARLTACQARHVAYYFIVLSACEKIRVHPLRRRRIKNHAVGSGARVVIREKTHPCASVKSVFLIKAARMANSTLRIQQYHYLPLVCVASRVITSHWSVGLRRVSVDS